MFQALIAVLCASGVSAAAYADSAGRAYLRCRDALADPGRGYSVEIDREPDTSGPTPTLELYATVRSASPASSRLIGVYHVEPGPGAGPLSFTGRDFLLSLSVASAPAGEEFGAHLSVSLPGAPVSAQMLCSFATFRTAHHPPAQPRRWAYSRTIR